MNRENFEAPQHDAEQLAGTITAAVDLLTRWAPHIPAADRDKLIAALAQPGDLPPGTRSRRTHRILSRIRAAGTAGLTRSQINRGVLSGSTSSANLDQLLGELVADGHIVARTNTATGGRPATVYVPAASPEPGSLGHLAELMGLELGVLVALLEGAGPEAARNPAAWCVGQLEPVVNRMVAEYRDACSRAPRDHTGGPVEPAGMVARLTRLRSLATELDNTEQKG